MFNPQTKFLQTTDGEGVPTPTAALSELMAAMGLAECASFQDAAKAIDAAGWSRMALLGRTEKETLQLRRNDIADALGDLLLLMPHTMPPSVCLEATHALIPGAGYQQMRKRIASGVDAANRNCFPKLTTISGLAATQRKPVAGEVDDLSLSLGIRFDDCTIDQGDGNYLVKEGHVLHVLLEEAARQSHVVFDASRQIITTNDVPPEALAGRPTNLSTLFAWQHRMATSGCLPEKAVIWSVCPYGIRFWIEAVLHVPQVQWGVCQAFDPDWQVAGALSEVGKIVYTINQTLSK